MNALSQASYIHVRNGENAIDFDRFNQAYMMHTSTSPLYAICASNDVAANMMKGESGLSLTNEVVREAVIFRQNVRVYLTITLLKTIGSSSLGTQKLLLKLTVTK